ncbi:MAG: phosphoribosylamine--glycine ligase [Synergistaceae bacterium]|jgi:phosphoribosylamine--glycine ligase|nr:phosphoribosylamine--glycine ligase [Synergistaceae bacterium]
MNSLSGNSNKINILILGGGGREHCLAETLSRSSIAGEIHCAPGNPGIGRIAELHNIDPCDASAVVDLCASRRISFVVVGPEAPLVSGVSDALRRSGTLVFGPGTDGARLEGSKAFAKKFMARHGVPTARFDICHDIGQCRDALVSRKSPYVIKADGLASGKGVFLSDDVGEAERICGELFAGSLGEAGRTIVIEDFSHGRELTVFALTDGGGGVKSFRLLEPSRDHKRVFDGDMGPNTGGMGAYAPVNLPAGAMGKVVHDVLLPTLEGFRSEGIDYRGVLYMGLMLDQDERASETMVSVVEYNVRFGDPETQVVLPLYAGDLGRLLLACAEGDIGAIDDSGSSGCALCVVLASGGYPGEFKKDLPISGIDGDKSGASIYHAGTKYGPNGEVVTSGGRVLSVVGLGDSFDEARRVAYERAAGIKFDGVHYRKDIGWSEG